jgi:hypothetical protein
MTMRSKKFTSFAFIGLLVCCSAIAAQEGSSDDPKNPFSEGTTKTQLSTTERSELLVYAENSKTLLAQALANAYGKGFREANEIYLQAIKRVVIESYANKPRTELLMRHALNQALELTFGVPTADGIGVLVPGILMGSTNQELLTLILEDSIKLALGYYQDDRKAIESGNLIGLPYVKFSLDRLVIARKWLSSVVEWRFTYDFSVAILQHWLNTVLNVDQLHRAAYAEEIVQVDGVLKSFVASDALKPVLDSEMVQRRVRQLRGLIRKMLQKSNRGVGAVVAPVVAGPSQERTKTSKDMSQAEAIAWLQAGHSLRLKLLKSEGCLNAAGVYELNMDGLFFDVLGYNTCVQEVAVARYQNADITAGQVSLWGLVYRLGDHGLLLNFNWDVVGSYWKWKGDERRK